jgi:hypothetical protein
MLPQREPISKDDGIVSFGLLDFREALSGAMEDFFNKLATDVSLQKKTLRR